MVDGARTGGGGGRVVLTSVTSRGSIKGGRAGVEAGNDGRALQSLRLYWTGPQTVEAVSTGERRHARSFSPRTRKWKSRSGGCFCMSLQSSSREDPGLVVLPR
jgi:hypothetical protein